jgi:hypothetical protein
MPYRSDTADSAPARADAARVAALERKASREELTKIADEMAKKIAQMQGAINNIRVKIGRPGGSGIDVASASLREQARGLLETKYFNSVTNRRPGRALRLGMRHAGSQQPS